MFEIPEYSEGFPFDGDPAAALETAKIALLGAEFEIEAMDASRIVAIAPGMSSTKRHPPLRGATRIEIAVSATSIDIQAAFRGVRSMKSFLYILPLAIVLLNTIAFFSIRLATSHDIVSQQRRADGRQARRGQASRLRRSVLLVGLSVRNRRGVMEDELPAVR